MDELHLVLATSGGGHWEKQVCSVILPAEKGLLGVLKNHAPMLCAVKAGVLTARSSDGEKLRIRVGDGIASVADNEITLLLSDMELPEG